MEDNLGNFVRIGGRLSAGEDSLTLNVRGRVIQFPVKILHRAPASKLGQLAQVIQYRHNVTAKDILDSYLNTDPDECYCLVDRNPVHFVRILQYYSTGILHFPHDMCWRAIENEMVYWNINDKVLSPCCR